MAKSNKKTVTADNSTMDLVEVCDTQGELHEFEGKGMNFFQEDSGMVRIYCEGDHGATACFSSPIWVKRTKAKDRD